jgi:hypothetical protein
MENVRSFAQLAAQIVIQMAYVLNAMQIID